MLHINKIPHITLAVYSKTKSRRSSHLESLRIIARERRTDNYISFLFCFSNNQNADLQHMYILS